MILPCHQPTLYVFALVDWIGSQKPAQIETSTLDLNQDEVTASALHEPQICAVGDHVIPQSKKELVNARRTSLKSFSKNEDSQKRSELANSKMQCNAHGKWIALACKEFDRPRSIGSSTVLTVIPGSTEIGPVVDAFVSEDQGLMRDEIEIPTASLVEKYCMGPRKLRSCTNVTSINRIRTRD